jgi:hypothetical protein
MTPNPMVPEDMHPGRRYRLVHRRDSQRYDRVSVMVYLGRGRVYQRGEAEFEFSARPQFGTQALQRHQIKEITEVPSSTPISVNLRA